MTQQHNWLALDIGGANLKVADGRGYAVSVAFALWREPSRLPEALRNTLAAAPPADRLAVTMTGELADCFETKAEGVVEILRAVKSVAADLHVVVYSNEGRLVDPDHARKNPLTVAAANWHALATFAGRFAPHGTAVLIDIGSTTTDVVGLIEGKPDSEGLTDTDRLIAGELVYTGVRRTPVSMVTSELPFRNRRCPVAAEVFATMSDIYVMLGQMPEMPNDRDTANGRPSTQSMARDRLARVICADRTTFSFADAIVLARAAAAAQTKQIESAVRTVSGRLPQSPDSILVSGGGEFLAKRVGCAVSSTAVTIAISEQLGVGVSICAPAHALAVLAREANS